MASEEAATSGIQSENKSVRFDLLKVAEAKSNERWIKAQKLSDLQNHLPSAIAKDKKYLEVLHEKVNKQIAEDIGKAFASRYDGQIFSQQKCIAISTVSATLALN